MKNNFGASSPVSHSAHHDVLVVDVAPYPPFNYPCNQTGYGNKLYPRSGTFCNQPTLGVSHEYCEYFLRINKIPHEFQFHDGPVQWGTVGGPNCTHISGLMGNSMANNTLMCVLWVMTAGRLRCGVQFTYPLLFKSLSYSNGLVMRNSILIRSNVMANPFTLLHTFSIGVWGSLICLVLLTSVVYIAADKLMSDIWRHKNPESSVQAVFKLMSVLMDQCYFDFEYMPQSSRSIIASSMFLAFVSANLFESGLLKILLLRKPDDGIRNTRDLIERIKHQGYKMLWSDDHKDYPFEVSVRDATNGLYWELNQTLAEDKLKRVKTTTEALDYVQTHEKHVFVIGNYITAKFNLLLGRCDLIYRELDDITKYELQGFLLLKRNKYAKQINSAMSTTAAVLQSLGHSYYRRAELEEMRKCPPVEPVKYEPIAYNSFSPLISLLALLYSISVLSLIVEFISDHNSHSEYSTDSDMTDFLY